MKRSSQSPKDPFSSALGMLARRPYSVAELRRALERKFSAGAPVDNAISRLRQLGFLDDKKFADQYARALIRNRAFGRARIQRELKAKLVDYRTIQPALEAAYDETSEPELLAKTLDKKLRTLRLPVTRSRLQLLCASLLRHGFRGDDIMKAVRSRPELKPVAEDAVDVAMEEEDE